MTDPKVARCYDPEWKYVGKDATNIRALFDKVRAELAAKQAQASTVRPLRKAKP